MFWVLVLMDPLLLPSSPLLVSSARSAALAGADTVLLLGARWPNSWVLYKVMS